MALREWMYGIHCIGGRRCGLSRREEGDEPEERKEPSDAATEALVAAERRRMIDRVLTHAALREQAAIMPDKAASEIRFVTRCIDTPDAIEVCSQSVEKGSELRGFLIREAIQRLAITLEQNRAGVWQTSLRGLSERKEAAPPIRRVGRASDQPIPLHADQNLRHGGLLDLGKPGQVSLRLCSAILKCNQHRQVAYTKPQRLEACLGQACEPTCR